VLPERITAAQAVIMLFGVLGLATYASAEDYHPIHATMANTTITLTGHDLTVEQVVQVARYGARPWSRVVASSSSKLGWPRTSVVNRAIRTALANASIAVTARATMMANPVMPP
jgi:hypothetical protein